MRKSRALFSAVLTVVVSLSLPGTAQAYRPDTAGASIVPVRALPGWRVCENRLERFSIQYPRRWHTAALRPREACRQFDRRPFTVPPNSEYPITAMNAVPTTSTVAAYIAAVTDPDYAVTKLLRSTTVRGHRAVRFEVVATGEGLYPKGLRTYGYAIDRGGKAFAVFTMTMPGDRRYFRNKVVIQWAVLTLQFRR